MAEAPPRGRWSLSDYQDSEIDSRYFCWRCFIERNVPGALDRDAWRNLLTGNALETAEYPALSGAHERAAEFLAQASARSAPISTGIATDLCPECQEPMALRDARTDRSGPPQTSRDEAPREPLGTEEVHPLWDPELDG
jgi:hypothetical protein